MQRLPSVRIVPAALLVAMASFLCACGTQVEGPSPVPRSTSPGEARTVQPAAGAAIAKMPASATRATPSHSPSPTGSRKSIALQSPQGGAGVGTNGSSSVASGASSGVAPDPSGVSVPVGNLPGWKQVFHDEFASETVNTGQFSSCSNATYVCSGLPAPAKSQWWDYPDGWSDTESHCEYEPSQTLSISGQVLNMFIHTSQSGTCMTAAPMPKLADATSGDGQLYGMYSVRMKSDPVPGYIAAFLLWPDSEIWPQDGEIDFPNGSLTGTVGAYLHFRGATSGSQQDAYTTNTTFTTWHTYTLEWTPAYLKFLIDGNVVGNSTDASIIPNTPMHWVMQTESSLSSTRPAVSAQGNLQIAWAAVWSYDPSAN